MLEQEIRQRAALFGGRSVTQMHWGGGTPTWLSKAQMSRLMAVLRKCFNFSATAEISIEVDPREIELDILDHLRALGFTRLSMGVQDFNKVVQERVNRVQDEAFIFALIKRARTGLYLKQYRPDLRPADANAGKLRLYAAKVAELRPDRLSVFNYAHLPTLFAAQRKIKDDELPGPAQKLVILQQTIATLTAQGYHYIGMDHFARPDDELAVAQRAASCTATFRVTPLTATPLTATPIC